MAEERNTNTGGGPSVGGNVSAGHDFVSRDKYNVGDGGSSAGSRIDIRNESPVDPHRNTNREILEKMQAALLGDQYNLAQPGLLKSVAELSASMAGFHAWRTAADIERSNLGRDIKHYQDHTNYRLDKADSRLSQFMVIVWVTLSVVGVVYSIFSPQSQGQFFPSEA